MIDEETAIVMCYTGWSQETAKAAVAQWQAIKGGWDVKFMKQYLSARDLERLERLMSSDPVRAPEETE